MSELPQGWEWTTLAQISQIKGGITKGQKRGPSAQVRSVPYLRVANVQRGRLDLTSIKEIEATEEEIYELRLIRDDLLFTEGGDRDKLGRGWVWNDEIPECIHQNHIFRARLGSQKLNAKYVSWYCNQVGAEYFLSQAKQTTNLASINITKLGQLPIALAPVNEQKRIADKLDSLLARVDACRERLDRVPGILKRFRQAVLAAATSGELTWEWRGESKEHLLEQTPRTWSRCLIKEAGRVQLGRQRSPKYHSGSNMRPYLRVQNIFEDRIDLSDVMEMDFPGEDFERYKLHPGDILLNEGQSPEFLGRPAMYNGELPDACFTNTLIRFQAHEFVSPHFALLVFRHYMHAGRFSSEGTITTNIAHLGAGRFGNIEFPLPSLAEQAEIVRRATILLSFADHCENEVKRGRSAADHLTPSLLSKAFRGELVPQDPNDEPASELLARIRAAGTEPPTVKRGRKAGAR